MSIYSALWTGIAQSACRLATRWTVRGSNSPIPVAEGSEASVCGHLLAGIVGSNPAGGMDVRVVLYSKDQRQS